MCVDVSMCMCQGHGGRGGGAGVSGGCEIPDVGARIST